MSTICKRCVYKNNSRNNKINYKPVSILSNPSRVHRKCMFDEMAEYFDILSKQQYEKVLVYKTAY